jgi:acyl carrier protein
MADAPMGRGEILAMIRGVLADVLDNPPLQIGETTTAEQVPDWDSINHVKLLIGIESELNFRFAVEEIEGLGTVSALIDLIQKKLAA